MNTDLQWEKWGRQDPYYGVLTNEEFRMRNMTDEAKSRFFESGRNHVGHVIEICRQHFRQTFSPRRVLDFGCGTGRLIIPFAEISDHVVGLDVSHSMLKEAQNNCDEYDVKNVSFLLSDDKLSSLTGEFDLIHSFIVFQHIPVERGNRILINLLRHAAAGAIFALHFTYSKEAFRKEHGLPPAESYASSIYRAAKTKFRRMLKIPARLTENPKGAGIRPRDPEMQMNPYNINQIFFLIQSVGVDDLYVEFTNHGGEFGIFLYFRTPKTA